MIFSTAKQELIRKEFNHLSTNYFNTAYFGPTPYRAKQKLSNALFKELDPSFFPFHSWMGIPDRIRSKIAHLLKVFPNQLALGTSTSDFMSMIANHYPIGSAGIHVVTLNGEYPSSVLPWMVAREYRKGIHLHLLDAPEKSGDLLNIAWLEKNLPANANVVCLSHVQFDTGRCFNLREVAAYLKNRNIFFILDATQSLGGIKISQDDLTNVDVMCCSTYKWFLGPYGQAFAYFSSHALDIIPHNCGNWQVSPNSREVTNLTNYTKETLPGARKFDRGQAPNMLANSCLEASLEIFEELTLDDIQNHNAEIRNYFLSQLSLTKFELVTPRDPDSLSNIVAIKTKTIDPNILEAELKHRNIDVSVREGKVRMSFHLFNTKKQVETLLEALET